MKRRVGWGYLLVYVALAVIIAIVVGTVALSFWMLSVASMLGV